MTIPATQIISVRNCVPIMPCPTGARNFSFLWGKAYKLPSFYALGNPIVGDPTLKPEEAENFEGGCHPDAVGFRGAGRWRLSPPTIAT